MKQTSLKSIIQHEKTEIVAVSNEIQKVLESSTKVTVFYKKLFEQLVNTIQQFLTS